MQKICGLMKQWIKIERIPGPLASAYEKATRLAIDIYYSEVAAEIVSEFEDGRILDLGTGPGYLPIEIVKRAAKVKITGIDLSRRLIQMARQNAQKAGFADKLEFFVGNSASLRFDNASFDMVLSTGMLHSLKNPAKVFQEIYRVLRNGGQAWIYDPAKIASYIDRNKWRASLTKRELFYLWVFKSLGLIRPIKTYQRDQVIEMIRDIDFEIISIDEVTDEIRIRLRK
jgi:ubiquinone/menaquinone biosynthesis C-methylase UbiE